VRREVGVAIPERARLVRAARWIAHQSAAQICQREQRTRVGFRHEEEDEALILRERRDIDVLVLHILEHKRRQDVPDVERRELRRCGVRVLARRDILRDLCVVLLRLRNNQVITVISERNREQKAPSSS
jgi:hypothetical protein